jgi:beta-galactosidase
MPAGLYINPTVAGNFEIPAGDSITFTYKLPNLKPRLWSPESPNLYDLDIQLWNDKLLEDQKQLTIGFREFEARGNRFYLNGTSILVTWRQSSSLWDSAQ